jgi:hypothetical protein
MKNRRSDEEIISLLKSECAFNKARREFSSARVRIERISAQRSGLSPIEMRRMEFEAVERIVEAWADVVES